MQTAHDQYRNVAEAALRLSAAAEALLALDRERAARFEARPEPEPVSSQQSDDEYLDVNETARRLGIGASILNKARLTGAGPPFAKVMSRVRYHWPSVKAWAAVRTHASTSEYSGGGAA